MYNIPFQTQTEDCRNTQDQTFSEADLDSLADQWQSHRENGLELRHKTGAYLNRYLGDPSARLSYGDETMAKVETKLGISQSELNRMRWLASLYIDVADFQRRHPDLGTWTAFKEALPTLKAGNGKKKRSASKTGSAMAVCNRLAKSLDDITDKLTQLKRLDKADQGIVRTTLQARAMVLCKHLGLTVKVYT